MQKKRAFSILELMIVVLIMGLIFSIVKVKFRDGNQVKPSITTLKTLSKNKNEQLICYDDCSKCGIFDLNISKPLKIINFNNFDNNLTAHYIDYDGDVLTYEYEDITIEDRSYSVCLKYRYFSNNSSQKIMIKYFNNYYLFYSFFKDYELFHSLEDAVNKYINEDGFPKDEETYYGKFR